MKQFLVLSFVGSLLIAACASHLLLAAPPQGKQLLCHVAEGHEDGGVIINVATNAVEAHLQHGDCRVGEGSAGDSCDPADPDDNDVCGDQS